MNHAQAIKAKIAEMRYRATINAGACSDDLLDLSDDLESCCDAIEKLVDAAEKLHDLRISTYWTLRRGDGVLVALDAAEMLNPATQALADAARELGCSAATETDG